MKVFVSSTVFDLIDVRAELFELLSSMGSQPIMSDESLSGFEVILNENSIETCLSNVRECDEFILVLDKRYGPSLQASGFDDLSATHLEYNEAVKHKKRIHVFLRDRLDADYAIWRRNKTDQSSPKLSWVSPKDERLFNLLAQHAKLDGRSESSNWYATFRSSVDLKQSIARRLSLRLSAHTMNQDIRSNRFPFFDYEANSEPLNSGDYSQFKIAVTFRNVGTVPAFDVECRWSHHNPGSETKRILPPGSKIKCRQVLVDAIALSRGLNSSIILTFTTGSGISVREEYSYGFRPLGNGTYASGGTLIGRTFHPAKHVTFELSETSFEDDGGD